MLSSLLSLIKLTNLFSALALVFLCIFPYNSKQQTAIIVFFITYVIEFIADKRWNLYKWEKSKWVFVFFILYYSLTIFYIPFEQDAKFVGQILEYRLAFLAFGIIGFFGYNKYYRLTYFMYVIITTSIILSFYILFHIGILDFLVSDNKSQIFGAARIELVNTHMMFNYYLNISIVFCYYLWKKGENKHFRIIMIVLGVFLYSLMFITEGRTGFLAANAIVGILFFYTIYNWNKKIALFSIVIILPIIAIAALQHPKIKSSENMQKDARLTIWHNAIDVISEKPILGYGASSGKIAFIKKSEDVPELRSMFPDISLAHPHSQYLQSMLEYGVIGLIIFCLMNIIPMFLMTKPLRLYFFLFIFITMIQLSTDIYKYAVPIVFFTLWVSVFFNEKGIQDKAIKDD